MSDTRLKELLDVVLDQDYGLLRYVKEIPLMPDEANIHVVVTEFQDPVIVSPNTTKRATSAMSRQAAGAALDRLTAAWCAVGEGIERYAGAIYDPDDIRWASADELLAQGENHVSPHDYILFSDEQYASGELPFRRHDDSQSIGWVESLSLTTKEDVLLPASLTYFAYTRQSDAEYISNMYSTGLACGPTSEWAICSGLYESIERDAYSLYWASKITPPHIEIESALKHADAKLKALLTHPGADIHLCDLTTEFGVPVILAITRHKDKPGIALGASCNLNPALALRKAVIESFHTFNWCIEMHRWPQSIEEEAVSSFSDNVRYYLQPENTHKAGFLWESPEVSSLFDTYPQIGQPETDHVKDAKDLINRLAEHGHQSYVIDLTPDDIASVGMFVTRVITPSLQPMWCGYRRAPLDRRRFEAFPSS